MEIDAAPVSAPPSEAPQPAPSEGEMSPTKAKPLTGGFMPASLRLKRGIQKPNKSKVRRTNSDLEGKEDVVMAEPPTPAAPSAIAPPMVRHDVPARECRSADEFYNNLKPVQEGRHGVVYRATCKETGSLVALKNVKNSKDGNPGGFSMIVMREVNVLLTLNHPNIITLKEIVHVSQEDDEEGEDANWFLVMEFMEHDLKDIVTTMKTPFSEAQVKHLMMQLAEAVRALHEAWVLHRDLKTANLLLDNRGILKVCDLGMARFFGDPYCPFTEEVISRWYRPPEILLGTKQYTENVDVWSMGCIFGELLQRSVLLPGDTEVDQLTKSWALIGTPTEEAWPEYAKLVETKKFKFKKTEKSTLRTQFPRIGYDPEYVHGEACKTTSLSDAGISLLSLMLTANPAHRGSAEDVCAHLYFSESPLPEPLSVELLKELQSGKAAALAKAKEAAKIEAAKKQQEAKYAAMGIDPSIFRGPAFTTTGGRGHDAMSASMNQSQLLQQMLASQRIQQMQAMGGSMQGNFPGMSNPLMAGGMPGTCPRCRLVYALCQCNK